MARRDDQLDRQPFESAPSQHKQRLRIVTRGSLKRLMVFLFVLGFALSSCYCTMIHMPGKSFQGPLPPLSAHQIQLADELRDDVVALAQGIGVRDVFRPAGLRASVAFIEQQLQGSYEVRRQSYQVQGVECINLDVQITGTTHPDEIIIVGAHYDSCDDSPAANDNGSGVAATLALARRWAQRSAPDRSLRFAFFVNEEPPWFQTDFMGSLVYARACRDRNENIVGMISLETIGYYSNQPGSQTYPIKPIGWLYPDQGNFIAFVGNHQSRVFLRSAIQSFRTHAHFPSQGAALPGWIEGVGWSDHWSFWQAGYPAFMMTDTALFRYPHYHRKTDTPDKLDYESMARVVEGVDAMLQDLLRNR